MLLFSSLLLLHTCLAIPADLIAHNVREESQGVTDLVSPISARHGPVPHWTALGDSYSAGPGAGDDYDDHILGGVPCYRGKGAYGPQLDAEHIPQLGKFQFLACSGHVTTDVVDSQLPLLQWGEYESEMRITLSIGGNDLRFSDYVRACLARFIGMPDHCDEVRRDIENLIHDTDKNGTLRDRLYSVWRGLSSDTHHNNTAEGGLFVPEIIHTLYPTLFDDETRSCRFKRVLPGLPLLTNELTHETNKLILDANSAIRKHAIAFQQDVENLAFLGKLHVLDYNKPWDGHRLCDESQWWNPLVGPGFGDPNVWIAGTWGMTDHRRFVVDAGIDIDALNAGGGESAELILSKLKDFDITTCDPDSANSTHAAYCELARFAAGGLEEEDWHGFDKHPPWPYVERAFHPKPAGFSEAKKMIQQHWFGEKPCLRVLDLVALRGHDAGFGGRNDFMRLATTRSSPFKVDIIDSSKDWEVEGDGNAGKYITDIAKLAENHLHQRLNVVFLYAGMAELNSKDSAAEAVGRIGGLIDRILGDCQDATILVSRLIGSPDKAVQARIDIFNDGLGALVASYQSEGRHVLLMNMDAAVSIDHLIDNGAVHGQTSVISEEGYARMGRHWFGGVQHAFNLGWLKHPVSVSKEM